jgi:16S rRNA (adenine1518-N6/adenine1519-N6)-dimethyltransferase
MNTESPHSSGDKMAPTVRPPDAACNPPGPGKTRQLLAQLGHLPRRRLGQNFLIDGNIVRKSVRLADLVPGAAVVEVGPGLGTLTGALLAAGARVFAVELDPRLAAYLRATFGAAVDLLEGDAVALPRAGLPDPVAAAGAWKVVANLPYAVTTPWLDALLAGPLPARMVLMLQREAAERLTAQPGSKTFSAISIFLHGAFQPIARHPVARSCFHPVPAVDSVLLALDRRPAPLRYPPDVRAAIRRLFGQRRKQLGALARGEPLLAAWAARLEPTLRAEQVPLAAWQQLAESPR